MTRLLFPALGLLALVACSSPPKQGSASPDPAGNTAATEADTKNSSKHEQQLEYARQELAIAEIATKARVAKATRGMEVAEQTLALIFGVAKSVVTNDRRVRDGAWTQLLTRPIRGQTLGLFGLGRIGRSTAIRGLSLGMRVIATEQFPDAEFLAAHAVELVEFAQLLTESDYLSIHCPLNASTQDLFDASVFDRMRRGSVLINTARGGLVVEDDLLAALQSGQLSAAGLDVFAVEPTPASNPLLQLDNVVLSPHLAGTDERSMEDMGIESAENIIALHSGGWPTGAIVNDELRAGWSWAT